MLSRLRYHASLYLPGTGLLEDELYSPDLSKVYEREFAVRSYLSMYLPAQYMHGHAHDDHNDWQLW